MRAINTNYINADAKTKRIYEPMLYHKKPLIYESFKMCISDKIIEDMIEIKLIHNTNIKVDTRFIRILILPKLKSIDSFTISIKLLNDYRFIKILEKKILISVACDIDLKKAIDNDILEYKIIKLGL